MLLLGNPINRCIHHMVQDNKDGFDSTEAESRYRKSGHDAVQTILSSAVCILQCKMKEGARPHTHVLAPA